MIDRDRAGGGAEGALARPPLFYSDKKKYKKLKKKRKITESISKESNFVCFDDIVVKIKGLPAPKRNMINDAITVSKLRPSSDVVLVPCRTKFRN